MDKVEEFLWASVAFLTWAIFAILGVVLYVGIPIVGLYIVYKVAKYLMIGVW